MTFAEPSIKSLFLEIRFERQVLASGSGIYRSRSPGPGPSPSVRDKRLVVPKVFG